MVVHLFEELGCDVFKGFFDSECSPTTTLNPVLL